MSTSHQQPASILCSWCDQPATRNLDTKTDQACDTHFDQWFTTN